jgi:MFS family permease
LFKRIPRTVLALGLVSLFMDISSEMIHSLLPVFLVTVLHSDALFVGLIEGVAEATALITKTFSGALSDWLGKRKILVVLGYSLGTITKPFFALANSVEVVLGARFVDRIGKGIRGAPRDALVADVTPPASRGAAFGLRQSLDTVGAFLGPALAMILMLASSNDFRLVFWIAVIPGILAVIILLSAVKESNAHSKSAVHRSIKLNEIISLGGLYWMVVGFGFLFSLARFSEAFLLLRAESVGVSESLIPGILIVMNIFYALTAYPAGYLSDRLGRTGLLAIGLVFLVISDLVLAFSSNGWIVAIGAALWGLHMGFTQGLLSTLVADTAGKKLRATAFGIFNLASGIALLIANLIAGELWDSIGAPSTFITGAFFAFVALIIFRIILYKLKNSNATSL